MLWVREQIPKAANFTENVEHDECWLNGKFLSTDNDAIFAFTRKWDKKSAVLVVSNMSPVDQTGVNLVVEGGLMKEGKLATKGKVRTTLIPLQFLKLDASTT